MRNFENAVGLELGGEEGGQDGRRRPWGACGLDEGICLILNHCGWQFQVIVFIKQYHVATKHDALYLFL